MASWQQLQTVPKYVYRGDPFGGPPPDELAVLLDRHRGQPDALITVLEEIQAHYGYLPRMALEHTARELRFPRARVYGVATFYNLFQLTPPGRYLVRVCCGTACHVNGSAGILCAVAKDLGIRVDETTADRLFSLQTVACVGACSLAPVVLVNDLTYGHMTAEKALEALHHLRGETPREVPEQPAS